MAELAKVVCMWSWNLFSDLTRIVLLFCYWREYVTFATVTYLILNPLILMCGSRRSLLRTWCVLLFWQMTKTISPGVMSLNGLSSWQSVFEFELNAKSYVDGCIYPGILVHLLKTIMCRSKMENSCASVKLTSNNELRWVRFCPWVKILSREQLVFILWLNKKTAHYCAKLLKLFTCVVPDWFKDYDCVWIRVRL